MTDTLAKAAAERHAAREGATDAFMKALPQEEDWERCFPSPGLHDALTAIAEGSGENAALRKVSRNNPWVKPFFPTATELSKRLRQIPGVSRVVFAGSIAKDTATRPYLQADLDIVVIFDDFCPAQHETLLDTILTAINTGDDLKGAISKRSFYFGGPTHKANVFDDSVWDSLEWLHSDELHLISTACRGRRVQLARKLDTSTSRL